MPQYAGHAFCRFAMTAQSVLSAPMSLFYIFGRNINDSHYYYYRQKLIDLQGWLKKYMSIMIFVDRYYKLSESESSDDSGESSDDSEEDKKGNDFLVFICNVLKYLGEHYFLEYYLSKSSCS